MKTFLISYFYKGRLQQGRIAGENHADAYARLMAMRNTGRVDAELEEFLSPIGWTSRVMTWLRARLSV